MHLDDFEGLIWHIVDHLEFNCSMFHQLVHGDLQSQNWLIVVTLEVADDLELLDSLLNRHLVRLSLSWATGKTSVSAAQSVDLDISKDGVDSSV